jgi:hypothetical protein
MEAVDTKVEVAEPPFKEPSRHDYLPFQGAISESYIIDDEKTGKSYVHKILDFEKSWRYGEKTPLARAQVLQRLHGILSKIFEGRVADTQFLIAKSSGEEKIEAVQPYIEGIMPNSPTEVANIQNYIEEKSGGTEKLAKRLQKEAKVPEMVARMTALEITATMNWIKDSGTGKATLVDF